MGKDVIEFFLSFGRSNACRNSQKMQVMVAEHADYARPKVNQPIQHC
jgi:hypothetical protein